MKTRAVQPGHGFIRGTPITRSGNLWIIATGTWKAVVSLIVSSTVFEYTTEGTIEYPFGELTPGEEFRTVSGVLIGTAVAPNQLLLPVRAGDDIQISDVNGLQEALDALGLDASPWGKRWIKFPNYLSGKTELQIANFISAIGPNNATFTSTNTADRTYTLPDQDGTFALLEREQTFIKRQYITVDQSLLEGTSSRLPVTSTGQTGFTTTIPWDASLTDTVVQVVYTDPTGLERVLPSSQFNTAASATTGALEVTLSGGLTTINGVINVRAYTRAPGATTDAFGGGVGAFGSGVRVYGSDRPYIPEIHEVSISDGSVNTYNGIQTWGGIPVYHDIGPVHPTHDSHVGAIIINPPLTGTPTGGSFIIWTQPSVNAAYPLSAHIGMATPQMFEISSEGTSGVLVWSRTGLLMQWYEEVKIFGTLSPTAQATDQTTIAMGRILTKDGIHANVNYSASFKNQFNSSSSATAVIVRNTSSGQGLIVSSGTAASTPASGEVKIGGGQVRSYSSIHSYSGEFYGNVPTAATMVVGIVGGAEAAIRFIGSTWAGTENPGSIILDPYGSSVGIGGVDPTVTDSYARVKIGDGIVRMYDGLYFEGLAADPAVSGADDSRIIYNKTTQTLRYSSNGAAYADFGGGGGITGSGTTDKIMKWASSSSATDSLMTESTNLITVTGGVSAGVGTITAAIAPLAGSATWNNGAVVFNGLSVDITNTASASDSTVCDLKVGGTTQFKVRKDGEVFGTGISDTGAPGLSLAKRDFNGNLVNNNIALGYTTQATAAGTTAIGSGASHYQVFTGTTTQTVTLPVVSSGGIKIGQSFTVVNQSTGSLTVNSSGGNLVKAVTTGDSCEFFVILLSGTTAASWAPVYYVAAASGGGITGSGTTGKIMKWGSSTSATDSVLSESGAIVTLTGQEVITGGTVTASAPALTVNQTWNNGAVVFAGTVIDYTGTAYDSDSSLLNMKVSGASKFSVNARGSTVVRHAPISSTDYILDLASTWNGGGTTFTGIKYNVTDTASASGSFLARVQVGGTDKLTLAKNGDLTAAGKVRANDIFNCNGNDGISCTIVTAALNEFGDQGSMTFVGGILTAQTPATEAFI